MAPINAQLPNARKLGCVIENERGLQFVFTLCFGGSGLWIGVPFCYDGFAFRALFRRPVR